MWKVFLTQWNGRSFFLEMGNGSKGTGRLTSLSTRRRGLALNGKNFSLLLSLAPSGTPILRVNGFNFGATMKALWLFMAS